MNKNNFQQSKIIIYGLAAGWSALGILTYIINSEYKGVVLPVAFAFTISALLLAINWWGDES